MRVWLMAAMLAFSGPAMGQGFSLPNLGGGGGNSGGGAAGMLGNIPGLGGQQETPQQKREFCQRVAGAAMRCGTLDMTSLAACLVRSMPPGDSMRVAQVANNARGNVSSLMSDCGIGLGR
jgi:hypothetical protein